MLTSVPRFGHFENARQDIALDNIVPLGLTSLVKHEDSRYLVILSTILYKCQ